MQLTRLCTGTSRLAVPSPAAMGHSSRCTSSFKRTRVDPGCDSSSFSEDARRCVHCGDADVGGDPYVVWRDAGRTDLTASRARCVRIDRRAAATPSRDDAPRSCERAERTRAAGDGACALAVRPRRTRPRGPSAVLRAAVARMFAYVCQLRAAFAGQVAMPADLPGLNVPAALDAHKRPVSGKEAFD